MRGVVRWVLPALLMVETVGQGGPASAQTLLQLKFQPAEVLRYELRQTLTQQTDVPDETPLKHRVEQVIDTESTALAVDVGHARHRERIVRLRWKLESSNAAAPRVDFDSNHDAVPATESLASFLETAVRPAIEAPWTMTLTPSGQMSNIEIPKRPITAPPADSDAAALLGQLASNEWIKQTAVPSHFVLPDYLISKGDTWDQVQGHKSPLGLLSVKKIFEYVGPNEKGLDRIGIRTKTLLVPDPASAVRARLKEANGSGELLFDNRAGRLVELRGSQTVELEIAVAGHTAPQKTTVELTIKLQPESVDDEL